MFHYYIFRMCRPSKNKIIPKISQNMVFVKYYVLHFFIFIIPVVRKMGEIPQEQGSHIFYELLKLEDFKQANEKAVRRWFEVLFLLMKLFSGEQYM